MLEEHHLREQNYQLKNEITDLKNAFDLNRDILKLLSNYNAKGDPHFNLLMQIITRLTSVNNQAMINNIDLIHHKNALKQQNLKLNMELNALELRLQKEIAINKRLSQPSDSKMLMQEQFNALSRQLMATNEERIFKEQQLQFWKDKCKNLLADRPAEWTQTQAQLALLISSANRRYASNQEFKQEVLYRQLQKQNHRLKAHIEELQNRLLLFVKIHKPWQERQQEQQRESSVPFFQEQREQIRLLKYALNDIHIDRKQDECILTITTRFKPKDTNSLQVDPQKKRSTSWPKHNKETEQDKDQNSGRMMEERPTDCY